MIKYREYLEQSRALRKKNIFIQPYHKSEKQDSVKLHQNIKELVSMPNYG
jgi:hypothetical protein